MRMKIPLIAAGLILTLVGVAIIFALNITGTRVYQNKILGISFSYPHSWGEVEQENQFDDVHMRIILSFEKMPTVRFVTQTRGYSYPALMDEDSIYYTSSYAPYTPAEFCALRKGRCGEGVRPSEQCAKHIISYCDNNPPQNFLISKASRQNTQGTILVDKYQDLGEQEGVINISKHYYLSLQGETFKPLTLLVDAASLKKETYCISNANEKLYGCLNEQDGEDIENVVMHFPESNLGFAVNDILQSLKIESPQDQDVWYMTMVRQYLNLDSQLTISNTAKENNDITSDEVETPKPSANSTVIISPKLYDPALRSASFITIEGLAGANVKSIKVKRICEPSIELGTDIIERTNSEVGEWHWSYTVEKEQMCLGENDLAFTPSTCDQTKAKWCDLASNYSFISDIAVLHPQTMRLLSPKPKIFSGESNDEELANASEVKFKGIAGPDVKNIVVGKGGCSGEQDRIYTTLTRPNDTMADWDWEYPINVAAEGICRGINYVIFQPSTMKESSTCWKSNCYEFFSKVGYLRPNDLVMYRRGTLDSTYDLQGLKHISIEGAAGSAVTAINIKHECDSIMANSTVTIPRPTSLKVGNIWDWTYKIDVSEKTICRGNNKIHLTPVTYGENNKYAYLEFQSDVGFIPADMQLEAEKVLKYKTGKVTEVKNEITPITISNNDALYKTACRGASYIYGYEEASEEKNALSKLIAGSVISPEHKLDQYLSMHLRLPTMNEQKDKNISGLSPHDTTAVLEFIALKEGTVVPTPLFGWGCNGSATVSYLRPDRIIVDLGQGYETANVIYLWDGKSWRELGNFVPVNNPISIGAVNKNMFIIEETSACCDTFNPTVVSEWSDFVIDVKTLEILDVHSRGPWR